MSRRTEQYYVWSWEHKAWWRPQSSGYTTELRDAGLYTFDECAHIIIGHVPPGEEVAIHPSEADWWQRRATAHPHPIYA